MATMITQELALEILNATARNDVAEVRRLTRPLSEASIKELLSTVNLLATILREEI